MTELRFIDCRLARCAGTSTRTAVLASVSGRALLGPATFPIYVPETHDGERAIWRRGG